MRKKEILLMASALGVLFSGCASLSSKGDINSSNSEGKTAIISAVQNSKGSVSMLLDKGANVNAKDAFGNTPIFLAVEKKDRETIKLLIEKGANVTIKNNAGETPFTAAARNGDLETIKLLMTKGVSINVKDGKGNTILIEALTRNNEEMVKFLIENGANVNVRDMWMNKQKTGLMIAIENYMPLEILELMVSKGVDIKAKDEIGNTPLMVAVERNNLEAVKFLLDKGAAVSSK